MSAGRGEHVSIESEHESSDYVGLTPPRRPSKSSRYLRVGLNNRPRDRNLADAANAVLVVARYEEAQREKADLRPSLALLLRHLRDESLVEEFTQRVRHGVRVARRSRLELRYELVH
jgi:hypothetical protein